MSTTKQIVIALLAATPLVQRVAYVVTIHSVHPAWNEKKDELFECEAYSKSEAIKEAREMMRNGGNTGRYIFTAKLVK